MNSLIVVLIFTAYLCSPAKSAECRDNPCDLEPIYYKPENGYHCIQTPPRTALCTCPVPNAFEIDEPCRLCNRTKSANNVCRESPNLFMCVENRDYLNSAFACLCIKRDGTLGATTNADCDLTVTLAPAKTTATTTTVAPSPCVNGGVLVDNICHCPTGYTAPFCAVKIDYNLCERYVCKNGGVCANRQVGGAFKAVCLCPYGYSGEFCELNGTLGSCSAGSCLNSGDCRDILIGTTRFAYCHCQAGYNGPKCDNRYFLCPGPGKFVDNPMHEQGKYFECTGVVGSYRVQQLSCPAGLRFNKNKLLCTL